MRSSKIYRAAREYLGLSRDCVCSILGLELEDLIAIEDMGLSPSLDMEGMLYNLYRLGDKDYVDVNDYPIEGLNEHDKREVVKMFLFADEVRALDKN